SYAWTVNGTAAGSGALLSNQYTTPGLRFITLRACNSGGCDEAATTISVLAAPAPQLSLSTFALDFGSGGTNRALTITNVGGGTLTWQASEDIGWLTLGTSSGSSTGEGDALSVSVNRSALAAGSYNGTIRVTSNGGD